jgi:hypothetical protein
MLALDGNAPTNDSGVDGTVASRTFLGIMRDRATRRPCSTPSGQASRRVRLPGSMVSGR